MCYDLGMNDFTSRRTPVFGQPQPATPNYGGDAGTPESDDYAGDALATPKPDLSAYTLTVPEASEYMKAKGCKFHSIRKIQTLCKESSLDCNLLRTTRKGQPVSEWIVSGKALDKRIEAEPKIETPDAAPTQDLFGDANPHPLAEETQETQGDAVSDLATPDEVGDANQELEVSESVENTGDATVTQDVAHVASSEVQNLIEKAELRAKLEAKEELVTELRSQVAEHKSDKEFYKAELIDRRKATDALTSVITALEKNADARLIDAQSRSSNDTQQGRGEAVQAEVMTPRQEPSRQQRYQQEEPNPFGV